MEGDSESPAQGNVAASDPKGVGGSTEPPSRNTWMPTALQGGGHGRFSLLQHLIQWRHSRVTFMLNTKPDIYASLRQCSCPAKKSELTGQHKCPRQLLREMPCRRVGQQMAGRKVLMQPILGEARLKVGRQRSPCYA